MAKIIGYKFEGQTKSIVLAEDALTISYRALYHGFVGDKRIPYSSITAIQFKEAGGWLAGYVQFSIQGGREWVGQVNQDENAVQFDKKANSDFLALRNFVQGRIGGSAQPKASLADELAKLAALRDQGILTDEEFASQKAKLLST